MTPRTSIERLADDAPVPHPDSWPARRPTSITFSRAVSDLAGKPPSPARAAAHTALEAQARQTVRREIKWRARAYALRPYELDAIRPGLCGCAPSCLVKVLAMIIGAPYQNPSLWPRWFGFGGEVPAINLRGAMLYARYSRAIASRNARRVA